MKKKLLSVGLVASILFSVGATSPKESLYCTHEHNKDIYKHVNTDFKLTIHDEGNYTVEDTIEDIVAETTVSKKEEVKKEEEKKEPTTGGSEIDLNESTVIKPSKSYEDYKKEQIDKYGEEIFKYMQEEMQSNEDESCEDRYDLYGNEYE